MRPKRRPDGAESSADAYRGVDNDKKSISEFFDKISSKRENIKGKIISNRVLCRPTLTE